MDEGRSTYAKSQENSKKGLRVGSKAAAVFLYLRQIPLEFYLLLEMTLVPVTADLYRDLLWLLGNKALTGIGVLEAEAGGHLHTLSFQRHTGKVSSCYFNVKEYARPIRWSSCYPGPDEIE